MKGSDNGGVDRAALKAARTLHMQGRVSEAAALYDSLLARNPHHAEVLHLRGIAAIQLGEPADGMLLIERALAIEPFFAEAHCNLGNGRRALNDLDAALASYDAALAIKPELVEALCNRGEILLAMRRFQEALASFDGALAARADHVLSLIGRAGALLALSQTELALMSAELALTARPNSAPALLLRARAQLALRRWLPALESTAAALRADPSHWEARFYGSMALAELGRHEEALAALSQALQATGESPVVLVAIADLEVRRSRFAVAAGYYKRALEAGSEHDYVRGHHLHIKMLMCDWSGFNEEVAALRASVLAGELATHPMTLLSLVDEPDLHRRCAERFAPPARTIRWGAKAKSDKIKIAYVSSDFFDHPVAHLMAGIIEAHDRSAFDVFAVSLGRRQDQWTQRIRESTRFFDASAASDREAVAFARDHGIDIAVDLNGYTENARPQLFASRLAPVQMSYLGYLGTVAGSFMDYLIADQVLAPEASRGFCTEKMAYLPEYHWNWDSWLDPSAAGRRADHGLPESGFVFCSFNNSYKITPDVFESWMRILKSTSDAVLWLYASNDEARRNLEREAAKWIVGKERLVFAEKVALRDHISRQRLADIMLDTFPYGGGATSSNALRVGLPVLTLAGRSISSRMGASLLSSAGLEGLVAHSLAEYEQRAIYLAERPAEVAALRRQLIGRRRSEARTFAAHLERIYSAAFKRASSGAPPEDILARP